MASGTALLAFVTMQRLLELLWSRRNARWLRARGAWEVGATHYPLLVASHVTWLVALWVHGWDVLLDPLWTAVFVALQRMRAWILVTLGRRWTTRVIVLPEPLVQRGPYRYLGHPYYAVVVGEVAVVPLALQAPIAALVHLPLLAIRIRADDRALSAAPVGRPSDGRG